MPTRYRILHFKPDIDSLYVPRNSGGRNLFQKKMTYTIGCNINRGKYRNQTVVNIVVEEERKIIRRRGAGGE